MKNNTLKDKTILLVNTGSQKKRFIFKKLKQLGVKIIALNREINWAQNYVDKWVVADTGNHNESLQAVETFLKTHPEIPKFDGIVTFWEDDVLLTSKLVDKYGMIGIPYSISSHVRNKYLFRDFCKINGIPHPQFKLIRTQDDLKFILENFKLPVVLKPAYGASSAFVIKVRTKEELYKSYNYILNNISTKTESALADGIDIFVEEFIDGDEVDIDLIVQNGKIKFSSITDNYDKTYKEVFFLDRAESTPSSLTDNDKKDLIDMAEMTLEKLGIYNGIIHYEAKSTSNGAFPIEVNMRMGGDNVYENLKNTWDIDFVEYAVKIACGIYFNIPTVLEPKQYTLSSMLYQENSGILTELDIDADLRSQPYFVNMSLYKRLGDPVLVPPEGYEIIGWLTVRGDNPLDAQDNLEDALEKIHYDVVPYDEETFVGKTLRRDKFSIATLNKQLLLNQAKVVKIKQIKKEDLKKLKIGIVGNSLNGSKDPIDIQLAKSATDIRELLVNNGYNTHLFEIKDIATLPAQIKQTDIDIIINLAKKVDNFTNNEVRIVNFLESTNIPFTGADTFPLTLSNDKITFKKLLEYHDIPTPDWDYIYNSDEEISDELEYPLIVKPANTNNSIGIHNDSVVTNENELKKQIKIVLEKYKSPALIEEYIDGDEYSVVILGNDESDFRVLPLSRLIYDKLPKDLWHILTYEAKWTDEPEYNKIIIENPPKKINKKFEQLLTEIALGTYRIMRCRDYGQVMIKVDKHDNPNVIEFNANPLLIRNSIMINSTKPVMLNRFNLIEEIILATISRYKKQ